MELNIKDSLESVKIYGRKLSEFLLPDQIDLLSKSLQKDIEQKLTLTDVSQQRELLEAYTQFLWTQHNNLTDADNNKLALEKFIASYCG